MFSFWQSVLDGISEKSSVKTTIDEEDDISDEKKETMNVNESKVESTTLLDDEGVTRDQRPQPVVPEIADSVKKETKVTKEIRNQS